MGQFVDSTAGFKKFADSGSSNVSMWSVSMASWLSALVPTLRVLGELNFIKEAGVAGDASPGRIG